MIWWKTALFVVSAVLLTAAGLGFFLGCMVFSSSGHSGPRSAHFDGKRFRNRGGESERGLGSLIKWMTNRNRGKWNAYKHYDPGPPPPDRVGTGKLLVTFVNHSTVLLQTDGVNILTDPVFSDRVGPVSFAGPKRHRPPGIRFEDLPPIDVVLISHDHYDHLDIPTLKRLREHSNPLLLAGLGNSALLRRHNLKNSRDLDWWETFLFRSKDASTEITFTPANHFSMRGLRDRNRTLWGSFVVNTPSSRIYFAGDTGFGPHFEKIGGRFGPFDLALIPIGSFRPRWFMKPNHISPQEAVSAHHILGSRFSVGIHFGTFSLADDGQFEAVRELERAILQDPRETLFVTLEFGEGRWVPLSAVIQGRQTADPAVWAAPIAADRAG